MNVKSLVALLGVSLIVNPATVELRAQVNPQVLTNGSQTTNVITAVPFLLIVPDARTGGMGDAGVASLPDVNSMAINPSKLAFLENQYGIAGSYSPWLNSLKADINLAYLSGYYKVSDRNTLGTSLRYFSIGKVQLFDNNQQDLGFYSPNEFAFDFTFSRKFGESFSLGTAMRYIRSNLSSGNFSSSQNSKAGNALAVDASAYLRKPTHFFGKDALLAFGLNISNIGTKMSYNDNVEKFFLPSNLKLGAASTFILDDLNEFTVALDLNKLLVPTQPIYDSNGKIVKGKDPNVSVPAGIFGSFSDAPGGIGEEFREMSIATGFEYTYNKQLALRCGYFYEHPDKGDRRYFTLGGGFNYQSMRIDLAYMIAETKNSPLSNTLRFSLMFSPGQMLKNSDEK
ncbi:type IX secretion system outer membrane channel protein PorV [Pedobacter sp. KBW06]|uniref:type IX secretion system outer membrane channel protein PorV n=1 Tax=Pedobacter sp. KBW06 TaxID=2153359 RepID=UPI000F5A24B3|nr:type IX secretion system outer membrane channel protein PorV [Pedobacter sp. KBW06]